MTKITPDEAHYVLRTLMSQGKLRAAHIDQALRNRVEEIRSLRERLASLESLSDGGRPAGKTRGRRASSPAAAAPASHRRKMSPRVRALRKLQGKYMGYVRGLKPAEKARVKSVREKQGMEAAIRLATSLAGKS
ncbi:MAG: hypothetical protein ABI592_09550 [Acidobacteriota bacterium]